MNANKIVWLVGGGVILFGIIVVIGMFISYGNREVSLRTSFNAQQKANEVIFDKTWKVIQQKAGVSSEYADKFKEIYVQIMDARYDKGDGSLMKWIQESNPQFDAGIFKDLSLAIESNRAEFARVQEKLIDIKREHDNLRMMFPSSVFLAIKGVQELEMKLVTSTKTEAAFSSGVDNDVELFKK